jgi:hypothetical protein
MWIDVKDGLPKKSGLYLAAVPTLDDGKPFVSTAWYGTEGFGWSLFPKMWIKYIKYWMEIPEVPSGRSN